MQQPGFCIADIMEETRVAIVVMERGTDRVIASGIEDETVRVFEGNLYYTPEAVDHTLLRVTERTYTCPYKGVCNWIDLETGNGRIQNIGWVYPNPKPGYEFIRDQIAFYNRETAGTRVEKS
jgi:uncharacterized protein (DUF427 family)